ncbi:MAG: aspartyl/asparaginyl beta-hydroxylase domain-containing protein [Symploca sp. SIO2C1]|nr:aspartyl/asparaginyl beta-hydroxylase domain-containing protein [Symploca sp. SIO2C1]
MSDKPFYEIQDFPKLKALADNWEIIRDEFINLNAPLLHINRVNKSHTEVYDELVEHMEQGGEYGWLKGWGQDGPNSDWIQYGLVILDSVIPYAIDKMPETIELLRSIQGIKVCALVKLKSNSFITSHTHPEIKEEGLLQLHITLDAAMERNFAYLNVNGEFKQHKSGSAVVFDGSLHHFALNASSCDRTILYMEFEKNKQIR